MIGDNAAQARHLLIFVFDGCFEPVFAVQVDDQATLVKLGTVVELRTGCEGEVFVTFKQQGGGIVVSESVIAALPKICVGIGCDGDAC